MTSNSDQSAYSEEQSQKLRASEAVLARAKEEMSL